MPGRDDYDFGKHYYLLEKKLNDHINAKNDPHHVSASDIGLGLVENHGFKNTWEFEEGEQDTYMSSLTIKEQIDRIDEAIQDLESVEEINKFLEFETSPLLMNIEKDNIWFEPTPGSERWNTLLEFVNTGRYFHLCINGRFTCFALATTSYDSQLHTRELTLNCSADGSITIIYNEDTQETKYNLTNWLGQEDNRRLGVEFTEQEVGQFEEVNPYFEETLPSVFLDTIIFPDWLSEEDKQYRLNIFSDFEHAVAIDVIFKQNDKYTFEKGLLCNSLPRVQVAPILRSASVPNTLYVICSRATYELRYSKDAEDESGEWQLIEFKEI